MRRRYALCLTLLHGSCRKSGVNRTHIELHYTVWSFQSLTVLKLTYIYQGEIVFDYHSDKVRDYISTLLTRTTAYKIPNYMHKPSCLYPSCIFFTRCHHLPHSALFSRGARVFPTLTTYNGQEALGFFRPL